MDNYTVLPEVAKRLKVWQLECMPNAKKYMIAGLYYTTSGSPTWKQIVELVGIYGRDKWK